MHFYIPHLGTNFTHRTFIPCLCNLFPREGSIDGKSYGNKVTKLKWTPYRSAHCHWNPRVCRSSLTAVSMPQGGLVPCNVGADEDGSAAFKGSEQRSCTVAQRDGSYSSLRAYHDVSVVRCLSGTRACPSYTTGAPQGHLVSSRTRDVLPRRASHDLCSSFSLHSFSIYAASTRSSSSRGRLSSSVRISSSGNASSL